MEIPSTIAKAMVKANEIIFKIHDTFLELRKSFQNIMTKYMFCVFPLGAGIAKVLLFSVS